MRKTDYSLIAMYGFADLIKYAPYISLEGKVLTSVNDSEFLY